MAKTEAPQGTVMEVKVVGKLTAKELGNPKKVLALDGENAKFVIGRIFGIASECKRKDVTDPQNGAVTTYWPIIGQFVGVQPDGTQVRSGVLYLPGGIHESYKAALDNIEEGDTLRFALELRTVKSTNAAGYTYEAEDLMPPKVVDLLEQFRLEAVKAESKQLKA